MKKIVIVDDEYIILQGLRYFIEWEKFGYEVVLETQKALEAINFMRSNHVDILLSDIVMPEFDGLELLDTVKSQHPEVHVVLISSHSDFHFAQEALRKGASDYILKSTLNPNALLNVLDKLVIKDSNNIQPFETQLKNQFSSVLSNGSANFKILDEYFTFSYYKCIYILKDQLNYLKDYLSNHFYYVYEDFEEYIIFFVNFDHDIDLSQCNIPFMITPTFESWDQLHILHKSFLYQNKRMFYFPSNQLEIDLDFNWKTMSIFDFDKYNSFLKTQKYYRALDMYFTFITEQIQVIQPNPVDIKSFSTSLIYQFITHLENAKIESHNVSSFKLQTINQIQSVPTAKEFLSTISTVMGNLSIIIQTYIKNKQYDLKGEIYEFLLQNYKDNITLSDVSNHFNFSYHYMSDLFKNSFNESFNDVLNMIRIDKAQEYLLDSHLSLKDICSLVGFTNYSHFSNTFKKFTNMSPSQYRRGNK